MIGVNYENVSEERKSPATVCCFVQFVIEPRVKRTCDNIIFCVVFAGIKMKFVVIAIFALLSLLSVNSVEGKVFLNCELAQQLSKSHVEKHLVPHFICLAGAASQMNSAKTTPMPNKSMSYGLFQVS